MLSLQKISWMIPLIPMAGSILIGFLLVSFNRTINRLTKPISLFLIASIGLSTILSGLLLLNHVSGKPYDWNIDLINFNFHLIIYLNLFIEKLSTVFGLIILGVMISSYYLLDRRTGYVRYFSLLTGLSSIVFLLILNGFVPSSIV